MLPEKFPEASGEAREHAAKSVGARTDIREIFPESSKGKAREHAAKLVGAKSVCPREKFPEGSKGKARELAAKGARAMVAAKVQALEIKSPTNRALATQVGTDHAYINRANIVLEYAPELADSVIAGAKPLNEAYAEAQTLRPGAKSCRRPPAQLWLTHAMGR